MAEDETPSEAGRTARRRHWPTVTAVAAAVAVLAGALYGGSRLMDGGTQEAAGPAPLRLDAYADGAATAEDRAAGSDAYEGTGVFYRMTGDLPAAGRDAPVYEFTGSVDRAAVAELAAALSVPGSPEEREGYWEVGGDLPDGELRLHVYGEAPGEWMLTPYGLDVIEPGADVAEPEIAPGAEPGRDRAEPGMPGIDEPGPGAGVPGKPAPDEPMLPVPEDLTGEEIPDSVGSDELDADHGTADLPEPPGDPVSEKVALATVSPLLDALGLADADVDASGSWGDTRAVEVVPQVDGLPVHGWTTRFFIGPDGELTGGNGGMLTPTAREDVYPLIDAAEALTLLNGGATEPPAGATVFELAEAELGLGLHYSDGEPVLVPSWLYLSADEGAALADAISARQPAGIRVSQPAIEPSLLRGVADRTGHENIGGRTEAEEGVIGKGRSGSDGSGTHDPREPEEIELPETGVLPYSPKDTRLSYRFWGGVCGEYTVLAKETADTVTLVVEHTMPDEETACILIAELMVDEVELKQPVGDRTLLDEHGEEIEVVTAPDRR